jgi:hypothetical protein
MVIKCKRKKKDVRPNFISASSKEQSSVEIEEQLEHQRHKKKVTVSSGNEPESSPKLQLPTRLGNFIFDSETKTYFPKKKFRGIPEIDSNSKSDEYFARHLTKSIAPILEVCSNARQYRAMRERWIGKVIAQTMKFNSSCKNFTTSSGEPNWVSILPPISEINISIPDRQRNNDRGLTLIRSKNISPDLNCKWTFPSHFRSFDIQQSLDENFIPSIATLVNDGLFIRTSHNPRVWKKADVQGDEWNSITSHYHSPYATMIRIAPRDSINLLNFVTLNHQRPGSIDMFKIGSDYSSSTNIRIGGNGCNDVTFHPNFGKGNFIVAQAPRYHQNMHKFVLYCDILVGRTIYGHIHQQSSSDALCVEYLNPNVLLLGHRNGSISFHDSRTSEKQAVAGSSPAESEGSVTSILPLKSETSFLCKQSFGSCSVWDLRMISDRVHNSSFPLLNMRVPKHLCPNQSLSSCCTGVAIDPIESIVFAPFVDEYRRIPKIALWSLRTGQFMGHRSCVSTSFADGNSSGQGENSLPYFELCSKVTPSWELKNSFACESHDSIEDYRLTRRRDSWSLWFKSNSINSEFPPGMGSIHQLTFPWKEN